MPFVSSHSRDDAASKSAHIVESKDIIACQSRTANRPRSS
jgi:hypothetical protein